MSRKAEKKHKHEGKKLKDDMSGPILATGSQAMAVSSPGTDVVRAPADAMVMGRVVIENVVPELDGGRHPVKHVVGDSVTVQADIFTDGHEKIGCAVLWRPVDQHDWNRVPMVFRGNDRWAASFIPTRNLRHVYTVEAWRDPFSSLLDGIVKKRAANLSLEIEAGEALALIDDARPHGPAKRQHKTLLSSLAKAEMGSPEQLDLICGADIRALMAEFGPRRQTSIYDRELLLVVDRKAAIFSSWYELFPRSVTDSADRHGTFRDVVKHLPYVQDLGFDVLYFPPISPIGAKNRKGKNNMLTPTDTDVGSVYAIGSPDGGHDAIHPRTRHHRRFPRTRRCRQGSWARTGARLRHSMFAGPPLDQGASGVVSMASRRHDPVCRKPA